MISSIGSSSLASQMASNLFSKLDSKNQGYIEKSDLQSAFDQISSSSNSGNAASVDEVFKQLDGDGDGKVTKQEMSDSLTKMAEQLDSQFNSMRTGGRGGMPPPPPPEGTDSAGFTKDELQSQLDEIGTSDSKRSSLISNIVSNFDEADTDGDGKVSMQEAMTFDKSSQTSTTASTSTDSSSSTNTEAEIMKRIMQLMHAYSVSGQGSSQTSSSGTISVSA